MDQAPIVGTEAMEHTLVAEAPLTWGELHFGGLSLGDARRSQRLPELMDLMHQHPGGTLPDKLNEPADLRAFYRLMNATEVTHDAVLQTHYQATSDAIEQALAEGAWVLNIHDATELDDTAISKLQGQLGQIGQGTHRGYICHNSLAVRADTRESLGLTSQVLHHRADVPKGETAKQCRERANRESRLWPRGAGALAMSPTGRVVDVSDSLSDTFEYMAFEITTGRRFVLRSRENRRLATPLQGESMLYEGVRACPSVLSYAYVVAAGPDRPARKTMLQVSFTPVTLQMPLDRAGEYAPAPLTMWAIRVWETNTPQGVEPLEWILLTNVPVTTPAAARERVGWYECRFIVEEYHKGMKTGCGLETMQFEQIARLEPAIGVLSVLTLSLLQLRDAARAPDAATRPASDVISAEYIEVLRREYRTRLGAELITIQQFYRHVARLGGHQNRKGDGFPGWLTLWRGWTKLESMVRGYRHGLHRAEQRCGTT